MARPGRAPLMRALQALARRTAPGPADAAELACAQQARVEAQRIGAAREARRMALRQGAALLGAAALSWPVAAAAKPRGNPKIVVVGAGLAGLAAAWTLARHGLDVTLIEASPRAGGRCWTERKAFGDGQFAERGGELVDTMHDAIIDLALELGLAFDDLHAATPRNTSAIALIDGRRYDEAEAARDFAALWPALQRDAQRLGSDLPTFAQYTPAQAALDRLSASEWLDSRVPGGIASPLARLLGNAYVEEIGAELDEISAVTVVDLLRGSPQDRVSPYEVSDQRYRVRGGNDLIVQELAAALGSRIVSGTRLVALARRPDGRYRLTVARDTARRDLDADHVVLALPFTLLRDVDLAQAGFRERKRVAIRDLGMARNTKLQLQFADRAWVAQGGNGETRVEGSYQVSWEVSRGQTGPAGILNFYTGGASAVRAGAGTPEERAREALADLERVYPGIASHWNGRAIRNAWDRHPWSKGSYSLLRPGHYTAFHGVEHLAEGRVHFAGEQSSEAWYGYLNGAVESGLRAGQEVLRVTGAATRQVAHRSGDPAIG